MRLVVELDLGPDTGWVATATDLAGVRGAGASREEALRRLQALALRALADMLDRGETPPAANPFDLDVHEGPVLTEARRSGLAALDACHRAAEASGLDAMTMDEIDEVIREVRAERRREAPATAESRRR